MPGPLGAIGVLKFAGTARCARLLYSGTEDACGPEEPAALKSVLVCRRSIGFCARDSGIGLTACDPVAPADRAACRPFFRAWPVYRRDPTRVPAACWPSAVRRAVAPEMFPDFAIFPHVSSSPRAVRPQSYEIRREVFHEVVVLGVNPAERHTLTANYLYEILCLFNRVISECGERFCLFIHDRF